MLPLRVAFAGGNSGVWEVEHCETVCGLRLLSVPHVKVLEGDASRSPIPDALWVLRGVTSNERYVSRGEHEALVSRQERLARTDSTRAALIPIKKSEEWWDLAQEERRRIFEESSHHVAIGLEYLPGIARRLHHGRDFGEPFDFLTWFEFAPDQAGRFDELLEKLRATEEWTYVEREIDFRLAR